MSEVKTETCPTCDTEWETEFMKTTCVRNVHTLEEEVTLEHTIICPNGHTYELVKAFLTEPLCCVIKVPDEPITGHMHTVLDAGEPCKGCGGPIQPKQLYLVADGPRHVWCGR